MKAIFNIFLCAVLMGHAAPSVGQKTALLLIDIQEFYFPGGRMQLEDPEQAGMNAGLVLEQFRNREYPVYHVRHNFEPGGSIHPYVKPLEGEKVFPKDQVNAFLETGLLETLRADSIEALVLCGMQTHMCLEAAVRAAHDLGFSCTVVQDACATRALQYGELIIPARNVHFSTICTIEGSYAKVITTAALLKDFDQIILP
jgi:nicotinamidase-related amidase